VEGQEGYKLMNCHVNRLLEFLQEVTVMIISIWAFNLVKYEGIDY